MKQYWSKKVAKLNPYIAGEQPKQKFIKLNTNENAWPQSENVEKAILSVTNKLRLYPDPEATELKKIIAEAEGLSEEKVFCANGSDEVLAQAFMAYFDPETAINTFDVTYSFYPVWAQMFDLTLNHIALKEDYTADIKSFYGGKNAVIANPNAPTGIALEISEIEEIVKNTSGVVIVDEAYYGFGAKSASSLIEKYDNLVVVRTLSKSHGLAGLRVGFALAQENLIQALRAVRDGYNSYPVDMLAQAGAAAAFCDTEYYKNVGEKIMRAREYTVAELLKMGVCCLPSSANFIFMKCEKKPAEEVFSQLRERGILVRFFNAKRTKDYLRVTIGTQEEMEAFIKAIGEIL